MDDGDASKEEGARMAGAQSVQRAIDILMAVADGPIMLPQLAERVGLNTTTCYRLARVLADRGLLNATSRAGYRLGPMVKELARRA